MAVRVARGLAVGSALWLAGCSGSASGTDGAVDALDVPDASGNTDGGGDAFDAPTADHSDAHSSTDSGSTDSGSTDAGGTDSGSTDSGSTDAGTVDSGTVDSGTMDAGSTDAGDTDAGSIADVNTVDAVDESDAGCPIGTHPCGSVCASDTDPTMCGDSCTACPDGPPHSTPACVSGACGFQCDPGTTSNGYGCDPDFRLIAPLSTSRVTSRRPTLRWHNAAGNDGARVQVCRDRACASVIESRDVTGTSMAPAADLPQGVVYWRVQPLSGGNPVGSTSPAWQFNVGARSAAVDTSWGSVLDLNGDALPDLAVGDWASHNQAGQVLVHFGTSSGFPSTPGGYLNNPVAGSVQMGLGVASGGDVNGDGFPELVTTALGSDPVLLLYAGTAGGIADAPTQNLVLPAQNSSAAITVGDVNGDGYGDVAISSLDLSPPSNSGHAYVLLGSADGLSMTHLIALPNPDSSDADHIFGSSVGPAGDVDGDGYNDLLVGALGRTNSFNGIAYLYRGSPSGLRTSPDVRFDQPAGTLLRFADNLVCAGDVNGDGYSDLLLSSHNFGAGGATVAQAFVYYGSASGPPSTPSVTMDAPPEVFGFFAETMAGDVDVNGDGYSDLLVAEEPRNGTSPGVIWVYLGGATGVATTPSFHLNSTNPAFGRVVAGVADADGDGYDEIMVGAPNWSTAGTGKVYLYHGAATGVASGNTVLSDAPPDNYYYGSAVANAL